MNTNTELTKEQKEMLEFEASVRAEARIRQLIDGYQNCQRGRVNHAQTGRVRRELAAIEVRSNGKRSAVLTLALVEEALAKMES